MKNVDYVKKTHQKNLDEIQLRLHNDDFLKDAKRIRDFYGLPILVTGTNDPLEILDKAINVFLQETTVILSYLAMKGAHPEIYSNLDNPRIALLMKLQERQFGRRRATKLDEAASTYFDLTQGFQGLDSTSPDLALLQARILACFIQSQGILQMFANLPSRIQVSNEIVITPRDLEAMCQSCVVRWIVYSEFLKDIHGLVASWGFGKEWFYPICSYIMTDLNPVTTGFVPPLNVVYRWSPDGNLILEETCGTVSRDVTAALGLRRTPGMKSKRHNYPRKNQKEDLEILELSEQKQEARKTARKYGNDADDYDHDEERFAYDGDIASKVFRSDSVNPTTARRETNRIRKRRERIKQQIRRRGNLSENSLVDNPS